MLKNSTLYISKPLYDYANIGITTKKDINKTTLIGYVDFKNLRADNYLYFYDYLKKNKCCIDNEMMRLTIGEITTIIKWIIADMKINKRRRRTREKVRKKFWGI